MFSWIEYVENLTIHSKLLSLLEYVPCKLHVQNSMFFQSHEVKTPHLCIKNVPLLEKIIDSEKYLKGNKRHQCQTSRIMKKRRHQNIYECHLEIKNIRYDSCSHELWNNYHEKNSCNYFDHVVVWLEIQPQVCDFRNVFIKTIPIIIMMKTSKNESQFSIFVSGVRICW